MAGKVRRGVKVRVGKGVLISVYRYSIIEIRKRKGRKGRAKVCSLYRYIERSYK